MIKSGFDETVSSRKDDVSKGKSLIILSIATSIDALAIGLSLAFLKVDIWYPAIVIGIITGFLSLIGVRLGNTLGFKFGKKMEILGGIILILIGIKIVLEHLRVM
jgi:putative Mn2+ efflux pump MntP